MADLNNIIDLSEIFYKRNKPPGLKALESMDNITASEIISFILNITMTEVGIGLGLIELEDDDDDVNLTVYEHINKLYQEAAGHCYFCSDEYDPNETGINPDTIFCMSCQLKLGNFVQSLGLHPGRVFKGMRPRKGQVSKIKIQRKSANRLTKVNTPMKTKITDDELIDCRAAGMNIGQICHQYNMSRQGVYQRLKRLGVSACQEKNRQTLNIRPQDYHHDG